MRIDRLAIYSCSLLLVATLSALSVEADAYAFYAAQERSGVLSRFLSAGLAADAADFWTQEVNGITPQEALRVATLRRLAQLEVLQSLGCEAGLLERPLTHTELLARCAGENERRAAMKARGEVFYGPVSFREEIFVKLWSDRLFAALVAHRASVSADFAGRDQVRAELARLVEDQTNAVAARVSDHTANGM